VDHKRLLDKIQQESNAKVKRIVDKVSRISLSNKKIADDYSDSYAREIHEVEESIKEEINNLEI